MSFCLRACVNELKNYEKNRTTDRFVSRSIRDCQDDVREFMLCHEYILSPLEVANILLRSRYNPNWQIFKEWYMKDFSHFVSEGQFTNFDFVREDHWREELCFLWDGEPPEVNPFKEHPSLRRENVEKIVKFILENVDHEDEVIVPSGNFRP